MLTVSEMGYSKLHSSLVSSSLWCERDDVRILFITMLALADRDGYVWGSRAGIHRQANLTCGEDEEDPFDILMQPDTCSSDLMRNPENEGRRIEEVEGGFRIINYEYYRGLRNDDDRRFQNREAQKRYRNKVSQNKPTSAKVIIDKHEVSGNNTTASASASSSVLKEGVRGRFEEWIKVRKAMGKKPRDWDKMFDEQANWLTQFNEKDQIEILSQSIRNNWQGLFEPKKIGTSFQSKPKEPAPKGEAYRVYRPPGEE